MVFWLGTLPPPKDFNFRELGRAASSLDFPSLMAPQPTFWLVTDDGLQVAGITAGDVGFGRFRGFGPNGLKVYCIIAAPESLDVEIEHGEGKFSGQHIHSG